MSRPQETLITAVGASFYKNVSLLTQVVTPSVEFQRHFKKGMFDKPNTAGFLHVTHYLSTVCDAKLFKQVVRWPILSKRDEVTYRVEMKSFLRLLSQDNPDLNFPPILLSHLILAGGTKFQIIMWKLSQFALGAYVKEELQGELLNAPSTSPVQGLTIMYLDKVIAQKCSVAMRTRKETEKILDAANNFLNDEIKLSSAYKSEIFDRKENIRGLVSDLPANPLIKKRLTNVEDSSIIGLWKKNIFKKVQYIHRRNKELNELEESCDRLCKLVLRLLNFRTFDADEFPEICRDRYLLYTRSQHTTRNLHTNGAIVFSALLSLLHLTFVQMYHESIADLSDLSPCLPLVQNSCIKMKSLRILFDTLNSPRISFNLEQSTSDHLFYERLCSSPVEGKHKHLFRRHKRECRPLRELPAALLDFSSSWSSMSGWLSPRAHSTKCEQILFKGKLFSPCYSRLLRHSKLHSKGSKEHMSRSPSTDYEGLNLTPRKRPLQTERLTANRGCDKMRSLF